MKENKNNYKNISNRISFSTENFEEVKNVKGKIITFRAVVFTIIMIIFFGLSRFIIQRKKTSIHDIETQKLQNNIHSSSHNSNNHFEMNRHSTTSSKYTLQRKNAYLPGEIEKILERIK